MVSNFHRFKHSYVGSTAASTLLAGAASPSASSSENAVPWRRKELRAPSPARVTMVDMRSLANFDMRSRLMRSLEDADCFNPGGEASAGNMGSGL